jgi:hypothetical protein
MKSVRTTTLLFSIAALVALSAARAFAQDPAASSKKGALMYDKSTETTVQGTVQEVLRSGQLQTASGPKNTAMRGTMVVLSTPDRGNLRVFLAPPDFLAAKQLSIRKGGQMEVTGSLVNYQGAEILLARQVVENGKTCDLRDAEGHPLWSAGASPRATHPRNQGDTDTPNPGGAPPNP